MHKKILTLAQLKKQTSQLKKMGKKIVAVYGTFDILDYAHIEYLRKARAQGDILIVFLQSDRILRNEHSQKQRVAFLSELASVDYICLIHQDMPLKELEAVQPDVYCHWIDWGSRNKERQIVEQYGGIMKIISLPKSKPILKLLDHLRGDSTTLTRAVFFDRDDTINKNSKDGILTNPKDFHFLPGALDALRRLSQKTDYKIVIITNQHHLRPKGGDSAIAGLSRVHAYMKRILRSNGIRLDAIYACLHHPQEQCVCRKPAPGMVWKAALDLNINPTRSWFVGDRSTDVLAGYYADTKTVKLGSRMKGGIQPTYYAQDISEAVMRIIGSEAKRHPRLR